MQRVLRHARETPSFSSSGMFGSLKVTAHADQIAEVLRGALAVAHEAIRRGRVLPAADGGEPARRREVLERDQRRQAVLVAAGEHAAVVIERGDRERALLRLDARPLDREAVGVEAEEASSAMSSG